MIQVTQRITRLIFLSLMILGHTSALALAGGPDVVNPIPSLEEAVQLALKNNSGQDVSDTIYEVKKYYYQLLTKKEQLGISDEVRGHFEKAVTKAQEKMESDESDVSQSTITKLKLGLSGTRNDISNFNAKIDIACLYLTHLLGQKIDREAPEPEGGLSVVVFPYETLESFQKSQNPGKPLKDLSRVKAEEALVEINKSREKLKLARESRKITRALLVTEVANYDFGIGNEGDLFEALIIYTKVLVGYYDTIYQFNLDVLDFNRLMRELAH